MVTCYIGIGANLGNMQDTIRAACEQLRQHSAIKAFRVASLYQSKPMGPQDQPDYLNTVASFQTALEAEELLDLLQSLENRAGRVRKQHWGPRTLDLDLLLYGNTFIQSERLTVPHPGLREREFVVIPLAELAPDLILPDGTALQNLARSFSPSTLQVPCE